jgi:hypothetical protein
MFRRTPTLENQTPIPRLADDIPNGEVRLGLEMRTEVNRLPDGQLNYVFKKA